jgi:hypothetical protein
VHIRADKARIRRAGVRGAELAGNIILRTPAEALHSSVGNRAAY